jgi:hypothetical protein
MYVYEWSRFKSVAAYQDFAWIARENLKCYADLNYPRRNVLFAIHEFIIYILLYYSMPFLAEILWNRYHSKDISTSLLQPDFDPQNLPFVNWTFHSKFPTQYSNPIKQKLCEPTLVGAGETQGEIPSMLQYLFSPGNFCNFLLWSRWTKAIKLFHVHYITFFTFLLL